MSKIFWPNFLGVLFTICLFGVAIALDVRARSKTDAGRINAILEKFPSSITLSSSSSCRMIVGALLAATMTAVCLAIGVVSFFGWHMHHPQPEQGYRIWLIACKRNELSQPARLILRRIEA